jgi:DNA repair protein RecN (Recombination protein N)
MLRLLSIRNFAVVEALETEFEGGFTVLTGETGAGKSILLEALSLLLGDRFDTRQLRPGTDRAEIAAEFAIDDAPALRAWLAEQDLVEDGALLLRRVLDAQGRSRAYLNGRPATLAQLKEAGERLVDLHGQHAHQSLGEAATQRRLVDAFGGFATLAQEVSSAWRSWRDASRRRDIAQRDAEALTAERSALAARHAELSALAVTAAEWEQLAQMQSRLAHAASLLETAAAGQAELSDGDAALASRLTSLLQRLRQAATHDGALDEIVALVDEARIGIDEAGRALRGYHNRLDVDPAELARVESRIAAIHDVARKHRVRPEALPNLAAECAAALALLGAESDPGALLRAEAAAHAAYTGLARQLSAKRKSAAAELGHRVTRTMQELAMTGGRFEIALNALDEATANGMESVEFLVATHPKQPLASLARFASGGELSRLGLAIQVALSEVGEVPTLIFDEVDAGIGGAVAATVGRLLHELGSRRQILCVTHLGQVAACADWHYRVTKTGKADKVSTELAQLGSAERIEELARMLGGREITAKTRAHAKELLAQQRARRGGT